MTGINLHFSGLTSQEVLEQIKAFTAEIAKISDDDLLQELRDRMAKNGQVVKILPFAEENETTKVKEPEPRKSEGVKAPKQKDEHKGVQVKKDEPKEDDGVTIDDVKMALNNYSNLYGQVKARTVMQNIGGSPRLVDIPKTKYSALIAELSKKDAA